MYLLIYYVVPYITLVKIFGIGYLHFHLKYLDKKTKFEKFLNSVVVDFYNLGSYSILRTLRLLFKHELKVQIHTFTHLTLYTFILNYD